METLAARFDADARAVWEHLWGELERLFAEVDAVLRAHLRESPIAAWRDTDSYKLARGAVVVGRARLVLELDFEAHPPGVFGEAGRVLRLSVTRDGAARATPPLATLWIESTRALWTSTESDAEVFRLDDRLALERFFLSLLVDAA